MAVAVGIYACGMPLDAAGWKPGTSATVRMARAASRTASRSRARLIDKAIGELIADEMTPAAVELALEIRREIEARHDEADRLRRRAVERAQIVAEFSHSDDFMLVDPANRLVADTLEREWNNKLRALASAQEERERGREEDQLALGGAIRDRLIAMTSDFAALWSDPRTVSASGCSPTSSRMSHS